MYYYCRQTHKVSIKSKKKIHYVLKKLFWDFFNVKKAIFYKFNWKLNVFQNNFMGAFFSCLCKGSQLNLFYMLRVVYTFPCSMYYYIYQWNIKTKRSRILKRDIFNIKMINFFMNCLLKIKCFLKQVYRSFIFMFMQGISPYSFLHMYITCLELYMYFLAQCIFVLPLKY